MYRKILIPLLELFCFDYNYISKSSRNSGNKEKPTFLKKLVFCIYSHCTKGEVTPQLTPRVFSKKLDFYMFFTVIPVLIYSQKCSVFATTSGFWGHFLKIAQTFSALFHPFYRILFLFSEHNRGIKIQLQRK